MDQNNGLMSQAPQTDTCSQSEIKERTPHRKMVFNLTFGIVALLFAMGAATFASILSLLGFSVIFTEKGLIPMASCLFAIYANAVPAITFGILSQRLGIVCGLNKVSIALGIASAASGTLIFITLAAASFVDQMGILI